MICEESFLGYIKRDYEIFTVSKFWTRIETGDLLISVRSCGSGIEFNSGDCRNLFIVDGKFGRIFFE